MLLFDVQTKRGHMADPKDTDASAEKAYAEAASSVRPAPAAPAAKAEKAEPVEKKVANKAPARKPAARKAASKPAPAAAKKTTKPRRAKIATAKKASPKPVPAAIAKPTVKELKEKIMATKTTDFTEMMSKSVNEAVAEMQAKAQEAYDKGTSMVSEMTEAAKGNVEAVVESGKIMAAGMQDMGKSYAEEAKSAYETLTADLKEMAGVKSPTELFQLQGKIMRRNFDAMVATASKNSESAMKLANDAFAPISARVNLAVEKMSKAA